MSVIHILRDGTVLDSIRGHVVRMADAEQAYMVLDAINRKREKKTTARPATPPAAARNKQYITR